MVTQMDKSQFVWGLLSGAVASSVAILLTAPKSGKEVRSQIKATSSGLKTDFQDVKIQFQDVKKSLQQVIHSVKEIAPETMTGMKESIDTWQRETAPIQAKIQQDLEAIQRAMDEIQQALPKKSTEQAS